MMLDPDEPLITAPDPEPWVDPDPHGPLASPSRMFEGIRDFHSFHQMSLPAFAANGSPQLPPDEHVLDHLARSLDLVDDEQVMLRPSPGTVAVVHSLPICDMCGHGVLARYDALLEQGHGINLCTDCFRKDGHQRLGPGKAQYLLTTAEVTDPVRAVVDVLTTRQGIGSLWADAPDDSHWVRAYRACGFGGPDEHGRMSRELYGSSVWIREGANGVVHVNEVSYDREFDFGQVNDHRVPVEWDADQVRHFLVTLMRRDRRGRRTPYSRLEESFARVAERVKSLVMVKPCGRSLEGWAMSSGPCSASTVTAFVVSSTGQQQRRSQPSAHGSFPA